MPIVFVVVLCALSLTACGDPSDTSPLDNPDTEALEPDPTPDPEEVDDPNPDPTPDPNPEPPDQCPPEVEAPEPPDLGPNGCEAQPVAIRPSVESDEVNGSAFIYGVPAEPRGLLLIFHGGGGSKDDAVDRVEAAIFFRDAVEAGFVVVALDSVAHLDPPPDGKFKWNTDPTACNPDIVNVVALIERFKDPNDLALLDDDAPVFALGISNGGSMVSRAAQHIDFSAVATYITNAQSFHEEGAAIPPVMIVAGAQDSTVSTTGPCMLLSTAAGQGIDVDFKLNAPEAITPGLFTRIEGIDCELSQAILASFEDKGVVDEAGLLIENPDDIGTWRPFLPQAAQPDVRQIRDLLLERFGEHAFTIDFNADTLAFLEDRARSNPTSELPVCEQ